MNIHCPNCKKEFEWKRPSSTDVTVSRGISNPKVYSVSCPNSQCGKQLRITIK